MSISPESIKNFVRTYLDFNYSLFFLTSKKTLNKYEQLFDSGVVNRPLTYRQRISVILDEKRNLVVAGAGTGKTTTILAKILYLIKAKKCKEDEILALAFSKAAETELKTRLLSKSIDRVKVKTMHALGLEVIKHVTGVNPKISQTFSEKNDKLNAFITKTVDRLPNEDHYLYELLAKYFLEYLVPYRSDVDFKNGEEYLSWKGMSSLVTLNNDWVKSYGELVIGNYLYSRNISHLYESRYEFDSNYLPDFYLTGTNIYIEYFGVDKDNNTAPWINKEKYNKSILWKRKVHQDNSTKLIEITYQDFKDGIWKQKLSDSLKNFNVKTHPKSSEEIFNRVKDIEEGKIFNKFSKVISQFLTLFKSRSLSIDKLIEGNKSNERTLTFLQIFKFVYEAYELKLKEEKSIDFMDMLNQATRYIKDGRYISNWKYIIIDEFQDTSYAQYEFVNNLLAQRDDTKMYCVGDDWQSIFSFSGADYHYMTDYNEYFGVANLWSRLTGKKQEATHITLDETFRFNNMISHTTGTFIQQNSAQIKKTLKVPADKMTDQKSVFVHWKDGSNKETIKYWLDKYADKIEFREKSLLILSRYNFETKNLEKEFRDYIKDIWQKNGAVNYSTCHASKGTEEDVVLIIGVTSGFLGFPSNVVDDPVLDLVKSAREGEYLHAEERRLFYVAMTRAKFQTHILCDPIFPSVFAQEIQQPKYQTEVVRDDHDLIQCPECKKGFVINKTKDPKKEPFYQCSRADVCLFVGHVCACGGLVIRNPEDNSIADCSNEECSINHSVCKKCDKGIMKRRESPTNAFKPFMSCHTYPKCKYTEKV